MYYQESLKFSILFLLWLLVMWWGLLGTRYTNGEVEWYRESIHDSFTIQSRWQTTMGIPKLVQDTVVIKDSIAKMKLDKELIKFTKQVVLKHEPGYYREYKEPIIRYRRVTKTSHDLHPSISKKNNLDFSWGTWVWFVISPNGDKLLC